MPTPEPATDLGWLELQVEALYDLDPLGRLSAYNGPAGDDRTAPRFFFGRTRVGDLWRVRADQPDSLVRELSRLAAAERPSHDLDALPERIAVVRERLDEHGAIERVWRGPAYRFPATLAPAPECVPIESGEDPRLALFPEHRATLARVQPCRAVVENGEAVCLAFCATLPRGPGSAVECGLETAVAHRGRGHAARAAAAWAAAVRAAGFIPLYSTASDNRASRRVAEKLGLIRYATDLHLR